MSGDRAGDVDESKRATLRQFAALGAATPFVNLGDSSESEAPDAIAGYLARTPGAHFSKLRDDLELGTGETQHHLRNLERDGAVESRKDGSFRRYFPAGRFSEFEQVALGYLRRETPRRMLVALLLDSDATGRDLADRLGVSRPTISTTASELTDVGLLASGDGYRVAEPETVLVLLVRYADSFDADTAGLARRASSLIAYEG